MAQNAIHHTAFVEYPCLTNSAMDPKVPLEFRMDKTNHLTDLSNLYLVYNAKILKSDGGSVSEDDKVSVVNNFGYSVFSGIDVFIQDRKITQQQGYFPYAAYLKILLETTQAEKEFFVRQALWRPDTPARMDTIGEETPGVKNQGWIDRKAYFDNSKEVTLIIKVFFDFTVSQLIPDQTEVYIRLHRTEPNLCLLAPKGDFKISITKARLLAPRVQLTPIGSQYLETKLRSGLHLTSNRTTVHAKLVGKGDQNCDWTPVTGIIPQRVFIFQVSNAAYNGSISKNIFNFASFKMRKIQVLKNGEGLPVSQGIEIPDVTSPGLLYQLSIEAINRPECVTFNEYAFANGFLVYCVDLTPDRTANSHCYSHPNETGTLRITVDYAEPLEEAVTMLCVCEAGAVLTFDSDRNPSWE